MSLEIELKLTLPISARAALLAHPLVAASAVYSEPRTLINVYYDTPKLDLHHAKIAVRTRQVGTDWVQTIKCAAVSVGGLSQRPEWEQPYCNGQFDFSGITEPKTRALLEKFADQLSPIFSTTFERETRRLTLDNDTEVLLMIDHGEVCTTVAAPHSTKLCEIELELAQGDPALLLALAQKLTADLPLLPEDISKAQRGYQLLLGKTPTPVWHKSFNRIDQLSARQAFLELSFQALSAWQANTGGLLSAESEADFPKFLHAHHQSLSQLRHLLRAFAPVLNTPFVEGWRSHFAEHTAQSRVLRKLYALQTQLIDLAEEPVHYALINQTIDNIRQNRSLLQQQLAHSGYLMISYHLALNSLAAPQNSPTLGALAQKKLTQAKNQFAHEQERFAQKRSLKSARVLRKALRTLEERLRIFGSLYSGYPFSALQQACEKTAQTLIELEHLRQLSDPLALILNESEDDLDVLAATEKWWRTKIKKAKKRALLQSHALLEAKTPWSTSQDCH